jgi:hypothetical protein
MTQISAFKTFRYKWLHTRCGKEAHCLLRIYNHRELGWFFITSELHSNRRDDDSSYTKSADLGGDFVNLVNSIWKSFFAELVGQGNTESTTWIKHYGSFSYYGSDEPDIFIKVMVKKTGENVFVSDSKDEQYPNEERFTKKGIEDKFSLELGNNIYDILNDAGLEDYSGNIGQDVASEKILMSTAA